MAFCANLASPKGLASFPDNNNIEGLNVLGKPLSKHQDSLNQGILVEIKVSIVS
jgi:hypothetical protein